MAGENYTQGHGVYFHRLKVPSACARLPLLAPPSFSPCYHGGKPGHGYPHPDGFPPAHTECFFLSHLSFVDVCLSSVVGPKMLRDFFAERKAISFLGCALQQWFFGFFVAIECLLVASMAYDRYVAIFVTSHRLCIQLVVGPCAVGFLNTMTHTTAAFRLPFCGSNIINHFFCDMCPLLSLVFFIVAGSVLVVSSLTILISYFYILISILSIRSAHGRHRAFSTCSSHLTAVSVLYGTLFFIYVRPGAFYTAVIPMLNPLIYSLRNKEVKAAMCRIIGRRKFCLKS
uniref:G-protein coupled receptors family 1 profile domain-containing protein n=1 Tax=Capra hircus TaxID=9925 RepID=A0A452DLE6_CAPHI